MHHGQYQPDLDPNQDGVVDMADLQLVLESFGAATLDDFLGDNGQLLMSTNSFELPHVDLDVSNACGRCHSMDGLPAGGMLTAAGQENLCLSCHTAAALAMGKPIAGVDKGESHPRGVAADAGGVAGPDPSSELALHLDDGDIRCGTCHNPHNSDSGSPYLRGTIGDAGLCGECHLEANQWVNSGHSDGDSPAFNEPIGPSRQACVRCHSGLGFIDFAAGLPQAQQRTDKQVHSCFVCHAVHGSSADYILRIFDDVTLPGNYVLTDAGASATCMSCHNGRYSGPSQSLTPHHALGAVILEGINGVDFGNTSLTNSVHTFVAGCVDCHMAPSPSEGNPGADKVGGHSFNMDVHVAGDPDEGFENVANACNAAACHGDTGPLTTFNRTAFGDYDGLNGIQGVQDETQGLLDLVLAQIEAKGAVYLGSYPYWNLSGVDPSELTLVKNAIWNHDLIKEDGSLGIHNTDYTVGLLQLTYEQLAGVVVPGADLLYTPGAFISDECSPCLGDINDDNVVNVTDFAAFAASFDALSSDQDYNPCADLNHNGVVNVSDFTLFAASFDQPCP
jgi:predicted CXXCH cytochrome family protein